MTLLAWKCKACKSITYTKKEGLSGHNLPNYCSGCGKWLEGKDIEFLGSQEAEETRIN